MERLSPHPPVKIAPRLAARDLMHPYPAKALPTAPGWVYEQKFDGFRALVSKVGQTVRLCSRCILRRYAI